MTLDRVPGPATLRGISHTVQEAIGQGGISGSGEAGQGRL